MDTAMTLAAMDPTCLSEIVYESDVEPSLGGSIYESEDWKLKPFERLLVSKKSKN